MNKKIFVSLIILILIYKTPNFYVYGNVNKDNLVTFKIIDENKNLVNKNIQAFTFKDGLEKIIKSEKINIVYSQSGSDVNIFSVNNTENGKFNEDDKWLGVIIRDKNIITQEDFLNIKLEPNDEVILYYGKKDYTKIVTEIKFLEIENKLKITLIEKNNNKENFIKNGKIYIEQKNRDNKILITNSNGIAFSSLDKMYIYNIQIKDNQINKSPNVIPSNIEQYIFGINNREFITRGEAVAFVVNNFDIKDKGIIKKLSDIPEDYIYFKEINKGISGGFVSGYEDNTFKPNEKITLLEFCVLFSGLYEKNENIQINDLILNLPTWAQKKVSTIINNNLLNNLDLNWNRNISEKDLINIINNY